MQQPRYNMMKKVDVDMCQLEPDEVVPSAGTFAHPKTNRGGVAIHVAAVSLVINTSGIHPFVPCMRGHLVSTVCNTNVLL